MSVTGSVEGIFGDYECVYVGSAGQKRRLVSRLSEHGIVSGLQLGATSGVKLRQILLELPVDDIQFTCAMAEVSGSHMLPSHLFFVLGCFASWGVV